MDNIPQEPKGFYADPGTVSHGTMRSEDLIPCFMDALDTLKEAESLSTYQNIRRFRDIDTLLGNIEHRQHKSSWSAYYESEDADHDLDALFDALEVYAPPDCYFGAHEGDGADYGFWPNIHTD